MFDVSRSHTTGRTLREQLSKSDQLVAEAATYTTQQTQQTNMNSRSDVITRDPISHAAADRSLNVSVQRTVPGAADASYRGMSIFAE
jgi:hypothetical protein